MKQQRKKEMRHDMRVVLANLDKRWETAAHREVCAELVGIFQSQLPVSIEHVLGWVPYFPGEVDLAAFIAEQLKDGRKVYLPRVLDAGEMEFIRISEEWGSELTPGHRGILEPREGSGEVFRPDTPDTVAVLVPGLAFDKSGSRLGRGGGFYDRFLSRADLQGATKIGVCWSMQLVHDTPTDHHDVAMDWLCHERGSLRIEPGTV
jgi:5-formyltetrahydrofolate cyclo-ligase